MKLLTKLFIVACLLILIFQHISNRETQTRNLESEQMISSQKPARLEKYLYKKIKFRRLGAKASR